MNRFKIGDRVCINGLYGRISSVNGRSKYPYSDNIFGGLEYGYSIITDDNLYHNNVVEENIETEITAKREDKLNQLGINGYI